MNAPLAPELLETLRQLDACTLANAIESFGVRLRNEGFADASVHSVFPRQRAMAGYAATVKIRGASPPAGGRTYLDRTDWWDYILTVPAPRVLVVEDISTKPGLGALLGEIHLNIVRALGAVGAITNGSVRDLPKVERMDFPLFAGGPSVSHSYVHIVEFGTPVTIGGLPIRPGDLLHGDIHGVQSIPLDLAEKIPATAAELVARERALIALCRSPGVTVERLRAAINPSSR